MQLLESMGLNKAKDEYHAVILRTVIISSIIAQILLFLCSFAVRKGNPLGAFKRIVWAVIFAAADSVAGYSLATIFQNSLSPSQSSNGTKGRQTNDPEFNNLLGLWAASILLHLGGHSTITSFSLEDNDYWWMLLLLRFMCQVLTAVAICILSFIQGGVSSSVILLLAVGIIKFGERVFALSHGSVSRLIRSARRNSNLVQVLRHSQSVLLPVHDRVSSLFEAYGCVERYKDIYIDRTISSAPADQNRFGNRSVHECIKLLEMELGFTYDMFYSKSIVMHSILGWVLRVINVIMIVVAYVLFVEIEKHKLSVIDGHVTNALLIKAGVLEFLSFLLSFMSSHTLVKIRNLEGSFWRGLENKIVSCHNLAERIFPPSIKVGQFNLVSYCSRDCKSWNWLRGFLENIELKEFVDNCRYVCHVPLDKRCKELIFGQVKSRSNNGQQEQNISTEDPPSQLPELCKSLTRSFEERLLIYHIATELCHHERKDKEKSENLAIAKLLSDYMLNLMVVHPSLLSSLLTAELRSYSDTCSAAIEFLSRFRNDSLQGHYLRLRDQHMEVEAINKYTSSMLLQGILVARELLDLGPVEYKWELLFELWAELLSFAASQSKGKSHARQLAKGKELLTIVWLYMIHLGMTHQEADRSGDIIKKLVTRTIQEVKNNNTSQTEDTQPEIQEVENNISLQVENNHTSEAEGRQINNPEDTKSEGNNNSSVKNVPTVLENSESLSIDTPRDL
ncbi:hypothetical protein L6164_012943 [Bauhinia variegata]|uniref:Uncharacterized protein n=1 Tax=Bauhinia variegata TaxID=167791 RepID=A0ACB9PAL5_BAUVA|nr:hypothetical protein L6164_012943 [Bauhinia variegata]